MKKMLPTTMLGLALALGAATGTFAQDGKDTTKKESGRPPLAEKTKHTKRTGRQKRTSAGNAAGTAHAKKTTEERQ
jgi:hypothetical protein